MMAALSPWVALNAFLSSADLQLIRSRIEHEAMVDNPKADQATARYRATMDSNGGWSGEIDYFREYVTSDYWQPIDHIYRMTWFAVSYSNPDGAYYQDAGVKSDFLRALDFWLLNRPVSPNWWHNQIGVSQKLATSLLLMESELTASRLAGGIALLEEEGSMTGQNLVWTAGVALRRGLLERDNARVERAALAMRSVVVETPSEGIQVDGSFYQHGNQIYNGGYGLSFLNDISRMIAILSGTSVAVSAEERGVFDRFLLEGTLWMQRYGFPDVNVMGRDYTRYGATSGPDSTLLGSVSRVLSAGGGRFSEIQSQYAQMIGSEPVSSGHRHFWRGDYTVQRAAGASVCLRMMSSRTIGAECGNGENLKGVFQGLGMHLIYRSGTEYQSIFPCWDWLRLPGTTLAQVPEAPSFAGYVWCSGPYVGGVSDGAAGVSVMSQTPVWVHERVDGRPVPVVMGDVRARKSWFFFGEGFLAMGDGIRSASPYPVFTTVNQCHLRGTVKIGRTTGQETVLQPETENISSQIRWIHHDSVGYIFASGGDLHSSTRSRRGRWTDINSLMQRYSELEVMHPLFTLGLDHGLTPTDGSYSYVVMPDISPDGVRAFALANPIQILSRNEIAHAARDNRKRITGIAFFEPGTVELRVGFSLASDQPVAVLVSEDLRGLRVHVADPTQQLSSITLTISGSYTGNGCVVANGGTMTRVTVPMPQGAYAGSSVALNLTRTSNHPPMLNSVGSMSIEAGRPASIVIQALDGDAQILHYSASGDE
ncbi:MAG: hypothetical protein JW706_07450 [Opitutales bacterium]|nr:hypothetical protein [Opitutales bacterium]